MESLPIDQIRNYLNVLVNSTSPYCDQLNRQFNRLTPEMIFNLVIGSLWACFVWKFYLAYRQYRVYVKTEKVPAEIEKIMDQETLTKARLYNIDKSLYRFVYSIYSQILIFLILIYGGIPYSWNLTRQLLEFYGYKGNYELTQTLLLLNISSLFFTVLDLPWSIYHSFVIEERHGFNKYTFGFYLKDKIKKFVVMQAISLPITALAFHIIRLGGDYFFVYLWAFCAAVILFLSVIYPDYISPLFDKYVPLPESELKVKIEKLASSINYPLKRIYIVEGSKRSNHSNAYLYGMFSNKTIVLFDTLIDKSVLDISNLFEKKDKEQEATEDKKEEKKEDDKPGCNEQEILAVLGHELGHWSLSHIVKMMIVSQINLLFTLSVFGLLYQNDKIFAAFGFVDEKPILIGLTLIFEYIFQPYNEILSFLMTCLTRRFEFQADQFGKQLGKGEELKSALIKLQQTNLSFPMNDWLYSTVNHSHPPLLERLEAIGKTE